MQSEKTDMVEDAPIIKKIFSGTISMIVMALLYNLVSGVAYPMLHLGYEAFGVSGKGVGGILLFGGMRTFFGGFTVLLYAFIKDRKFPLPSKDAIFQVLGVAVVLQYIQFFFCYIGLANTSSSKGSILYGLSTYLSIILASFVYKNERMDVRRALGIILGFASVIIYNFNGLGKDWGFTLLGDGVLLCSAIFYAIGNNMNKKVVEKTDATVSAAYQMIIGGILLIITGKLFGGEFGEVSSSGIAVFIYLFATLGLSFWLFSQLIKYNPLGKVTIFNALMPIFGTFASAIILGESIGKINIVFALIFAVIGIYLINAKKQTKQSDI